MLDSWVNICRVGNWESVGSIMRTCKLLSAKFLQKDILIEATEFLIAKGPIPGWLMFPLLVEDLSGETIKQLDNVKIFRGLESQSKGQIVLSLYTYYSKIVVVVVPNIVEKITEIHRVGLSREKTITTVTPLTGIIEGHINQCKRKNLCDCKCAKMVRDEKIKQWIAALGEYQREFSDFSFKFVY